MDFEPVEGCHIGGGCDALAARVAATRSSAAGSRLRAYPSCGWTLDGMCSDPTDGRPRYYRLAWEDFPHRRDLARFVVLQVNALGNDELSAEDGEALVEVLEDRGLLDLDGEAFLVPILGLSQWQPLIDQARNLLAERAGESERLAIVPRLRATPPEPAAA
jgi:hypothetical protein